MDYTIESSQRDKFARMTVKVNLNKFARMTVKVNLNKPLVFRFKIGDRIQKVEYEDLLVICYACGHFGHVTETCNFSHGEHEGQEGNTLKNNEPTVKGVNISITGQHHGP